MGLNLALAKKILSKAVGEARRMGKPFSIAVVDERGWLVALHRMDGAPPPTVEMARDKAWTAASFRLSTTEVGPRFGNPEIPGFGLTAHDWNDRLTTLPGGLPIEVDGRPLGAVGVAGGTPEEDLKVCRAALEAIQGAEGKGLAP